MRHTHITEEIRQTISARQVEVSDAIAVADRQLVVVEDRLRELDISDDDDDTNDAESVERKSDASKQLSEERTALDSSRKLLQELLSKSQEETVAKAAETPHGASNVTFGKNNSGFQAHTVNGEIHGMTFGQK